MTEPTDADRKHAAELIWGTRPQDQVEAVARALAGERARFLALADELDEETRDFYYDNRYTHPNGIDYVAGKSDCLEEIAERVRQAVIAPTRSVSAEQSPAGIPVTPESGDGQ